MDKVKVHKEHTLITSINSINSRTYNCFVLAAEIVRSLNGCTLTESVSDSASDPCIFSLIDHIDQNISSLEEALSEACRLIGPKEGHNVQTKAKNNNT
jgi:hypothetical protein